MEFNEMTIEELEERRAAIADEVDAEGADLDALDAEIRGINAELESRKAAEAKKVEIRNAVAAGAGAVVETIAPTEERKMTDMELRNTPEYIEAYANAIKKGDDNFTECRALLTENVSGTVPVPELVYDIVKTAWERDGIMSRVRKTYIKGNLKVGFEVSSTDAVEHTEGAAAVDEETLVLGTVNLVPKSIKKWISVSDEALDLRGEAFLEYIYDELAYRIAKKAADGIVTSIVALTTNSTTAPRAEKVTAATVGLGTIAAAMAQISDEADNPVVILNKKTWGAFKAAQAAASYAYDPFEGLPVVFNNSVTAYSAASTGDTYAIVGDLGHGVIANFPNGDGIDFKRDDTTLMTQDLVRVLGRQYVAYGVVAPYAFAKIVK